MWKLIVSSVVLTAGVAFLVGCGDENTTEITQVAEAGEALPKCDGKAYNPDKQFCAKFGDGSEQVYKMTTIKGAGYSETWMAENLNYETAADSYCYDDDEDNCKKYGRLYTWATAVGKSEEECGWDKKMQPRHWLCSWRVP